MTLQNDTAAALSAPDDRLAASLRGFGLVGLLAFVVILSGNLLIAPLSAVLVLVWAHRSATPLASLGFSAPASWTMTIIVGVLLGIVSKLAMKAIVMPLLGAPPTNATYHFIEGNAAALPGMLWSVIIGAGFGEEVLFRGFLFERWRKGLGTGGRSTVACILVTSIFFAVVHYPDQGLPGVQQALFAGLMYGALYAFTGRLWLPMVTHAAFNITAVAIIYRGWERAIAGSLFG